MKFVLHIDDNHDDLLMVKRITNSFTPSLQYQGFTTIKEFEDFLNENEDLIHQSETLILLDLRLTDETGRTYVNDFKISRFGYIPIVIFSGSNHPNDIDESYENGASSYILKPILYNECDVVIKNILTYWFKGASFPKQKDKECHLLEI